MITILGSTGFVGSALLRKLVLDGNKVKGLARPKFDLGKPETYESIPLETKILIHSAGPAGLEYPKKIYWKECVQATYDLVKFINNKRKSIEKIVYISSGAVYEPSVLPRTEASKVAPQNLYGTTRILSENILTILAKCDVIHLRLFFPYGPGQKKPRFMPSLIQKVSLGNVVTLSCEQGFPLINPIYIDDLAKQVAGLIATKTIGIFNLGGSEILCVKDIADEIGRQLDISPCYKVVNDDFNSLYCESKISNMVPIKIGIANCLKMGVIDE